MTAAYFFIGGTPIKVRKTGFFASTDSSADTSKPRKEDASMMTVYVGCILAVILFAVILYASWLGIDKSENEE